MLLLIIFNQSKLMLHLERKLNELARANLKIRGSCRYHGNLRMCSVIREYVQNKKQISKTKVFFLL